MLNSAIKLIGKGWNGLKGKKTNLALLTLFLAPILAQYGIVLPPGTELAPYILGAIGVLDKFGAFDPLVKVLKELLR